MGVLALKYLEYRVVWDVCTEVLLVHGEGGGSLN